MKRRLKHLFFLALLVLFSASSCSGRAAQSNPDISTPQPSDLLPGFAEISRLKADGTKVVNAKGKEVILRAVGLGDWLLQEGYMLNPQGSDIGTQWQMKKAYYEEGLSPQEVEAFYQSWRDNFVTREDIEYIASLGFNSVRLPMHYELFLSDEQRAVRNKVIQSPDQINHYVDSLSGWLDDGALFTGPNLEGFQVIDRLLKWCGENNMYVVLDLHAAPGGQGTDTNIADILVKNDLWFRKDDQGRLIYQEITVELWKHIGQRYIDDDRIAWYDLINEPNNVPDNRWIHDLYERLINTIRDLGDMHIIMIEGNGWGNNYDYMEPHTFTNSENLIYNAHRYWIPPEDDVVKDPSPNQINRIINLIAFRARENVPVWVGETGENDNAWLRQNIQKLEKYSIGWCHWTYKRHDVSENAALMRIPGSYPTDGADVIEDVLRNIRFENNIPNNGTISAVAPGKN